MHFMCEDHHPFVPGRDVPVYIWIPKHIIFIFHRNVADGIFQSRRQLPKRIEQTTSFTLIEVPFPHSGRSALDINQ